MFMHRMLLTATLCSLYTFTYTKTENLEIQKQKESSISKKNTAIYTAINALSNFSLGIVIGNHIVNTLPIASYLLHQIATDENIGRFAYENDIPRDQIPVAKEIMTNSAHMINHPLFYSAFFYLSHAIQIPIETLKNIIIGKILLGMNKDQLKKVNNAGKASYVIGLSIGTVLTRFLSIPRISILSPEIHQ